MKHCAVASAAGVCCTGGCNIDGEDDSWDFGTGAGFYVDATEEKWKSHYKMYSYITKEVRFVCHRIPNSPHRACLFKFCFLDVEQELFHTY